MMGDKLSAKQIALACDVPTTPGTTKPLESREAAQKLAMEFGFPVILKAAAGRRRTRYAPLRHCGGSRHQLRHGEG